jgi:signal transduction histidine kinase
MLKKPLTIKQLLLLAFLLAGLLPAIIVSFLSFYEARNALRVEISRDMQTLSNTVSNQVESMLFERFHNVHSWGRLAVMQEIKIGDIDKRLANFLQELVLNYGDIYQFIEVVDNQNVIVASSLPQHIGQLSAAKHVWFTVNVAGGDIQVAPISGQSLAISQVIKSPDTGQAQGYLIAYFNWQLVQNKLNQSMQDSTSAVLFDDQNQRIANTRNWEEIHQHHGLHANSVMNGRVLPAWRVEIEKLHSVAVAPVHRLGYIFLALLISTLIFSVLLVTPIARAITEPLSQLTQFVRLFFQDKTKPMLHSGPVEVQELSHAFEKMTTDLQISQANLNRAAKLAVVGEMAAAMSHEVRTPLGILRSSADLLKREKQLSKEGHEVLGFMVSETERLNHLVSSLIDSARPRPLMLTVFDLADLIRHICAMLKPQAESKDIHLNVDVSHAVNVQADYNQMTQVIMNLLMNAIQVLPQGGQVLVSISESSNQVTLSIADDGAGISAENEPQIFEPFFTQRAGGVGLGLAVVRQIVQAHGGEIHYQTSRFGGADFIITLQKNSVN